MSVRRLLAEMDSRELSEWLAYYRVEPFGILREDYRHALTTAAVINTFSKRGRAKKASDFLLPHVNGNRGEQSVEEQLAVVRSITYALEKNQQG